MTRVSLTLSLLSCLVCAMAVPGLCVAQEKKDQQPKEEEIPLDVRFKALEKSLESAFGEVAKDFGQVRSEIEKVKSGQTGYEERLKKLEERLKALEDGKTELMPDAKMPPPKFPEIDKTPMDKKNEPKDTETKKDEPKEVVEAKKIPVDNGKQPNKEASKKLAEIFGSFQKSMIKNLDKISKDVKEIGMEVKQMKENNVDPQMKLAKAFARIQALETEVDTLKATIGGLNTKLTAYEAKYPQIKGLGDLKKQMDAIGEELKKLQPGKTRIANSSPAEGRGIIVMENKFSDEVLFWINKTPYRIPAGGVRTVVDLEPGAYMYRVWYDDQIDLARKDFYLKQGQTVRITAE